MTERMENALNHIKTSVDVDPWAVEEVERVFKGIDDAIAEIEQIVKEEKSEDSSWACGLKHSIGIIRKHTGVKE